MGGQESKPSVRTRRRRKRGSVLLSDKVMCLLKYGDVHIMETRPCEVDGEIYPIDAKDRTTCCSACRLHPKTVSYAHTKADINIRRRIGSTAVLIFCCL